MGSHTGLENAVTLSFLCLSTCSLGDLRTLVWMGGQASVDSARGHTRAHRTCACCARKHTCSGRGRPFRQMLCLARTDMRWQGRVGINTDMWSHVLSMLVHQRRWSRSRYRWQRKMVHVQLLVTRAWSATLTVHDRLLLARQGRRG